MTDTAIANPASFASDDFMRAMLDGTDWPVVFGPDRPLVAGRLAAIVRANKPTEAERVINALAPTTSTRKHVGVYDAGCAYLAANYYGYASDL